MSRAFENRLPEGHIIIEQAEMLDGRVSQTVQIPATGEEYERIVHADEAYVSEEEFKSHIETFRLEAKLW